MRFGEECCLHDVAEDSARAFTMPESNPHAFETVTDPHLADAITQLGPWFHNLKIGDQQTAPRHFLGDYPSTFFARFRHVLPADLSGWSVLDVGCNAGFYSFEMKRRGAARVLGIDSEPLYLRQAQFAAAQFGANVEFREASVYDVGRLGGPFDLVMFMGVLYHLRHPLLALDLLRRFAVGRLLLFQTMLRGSELPMHVEPDYAFHERWPFSEPGFPRLHFIEQRYAGDASNWWIPNHAAAEAMLRSAGFEIIANPDREVFLCRPSAEPRPWTLPRAFDEP
jgi:tRNA (mo5U34)-methyltransferase